LIRVVICETPAVVNALREVLSLTYDLSGLIDT